MKKTRIILIMLLLLNVVVLMGQIWPEGAPSFAPAVNLLFLFSNFILILYLLITGKKI